MMSSLGTRNMETFEVGQMLERKAIMGDSESMDDLDIFHRKLQGPKNS